MNTIKKQRIYSLSLTGGTIETCYFVILVFFGAQCNFDWKWSILGTWKYTMQYIYGNFILVNILPILDDDFWVLWSWISFWVYTFQGRILADGTQGYFFLKTSIAVFMYPVQYPFSMYLERKCIFYKLYIILGYTNIYIEKIMGLLLQLLGFDDVYLMNNLLSV